MVLLSLHAERTTGKSTIGICDKYVGSCEWANSARRSRRMVFADCADIFPRDCSASAGSTPTQIRVPDVVMRMRDKAINAAD